MSIRLLIATTGLVACLLVLVPPRPARAESEPTDAVGSFDAGFFARSQPTSAYDMVGLLPGFRLIEGDTSLRGYAGSAGNVLVDGRHPATKKVSLADLLKRIPAQSVDHIELIRSSASGYDMQGYALLANVVRVRNGRLAGRLEAGYAWFEHGYSDPRLAGDLSVQRGERTLDLQAALYREIDDEHGFGSRDRHASDGSPLQLAAYQQAEGTDTGELSANYGQPLAGGTLRMNGLFRDDRMFADIRRNVHFPASEIIIGSEHENTRTIEGSVRFNRSDIGGGELEILTMQRDTRVDASDASRAPDGSEESKATSDAVETILRGVFQRQWSVASLDIGAEGTRNTLDSHVALIENGSAVSLPAADVGVAEDRLELFTTGTWHASPAFTVEAGLRYETSRLEQSGDSAVQKSLSYVKPRLLLNFDASPRDHLRFLTEREVGQLDFQDFASQASITSGTITAGNKDLEPGTLWLAELAWEHRVGAGSIVLTARQEWLSNVVDRIAVVAEGRVFDAVGNIGDGRRRELQLDVDLPIATAPIPGITIRGTVLARHSRVTDPLTANRRTISDDAPVEATVSLTQDLPQLRLRWGVNFAYRKLETQFKIDEVQSDSLSNRMDAFVEFKPDAHWMLQIFGKNLSDSPAIRVRDMYAGLRGDSALEVVERRELLSGRYFGFSAIRSFGN